MSSSIILAITVTAPVFLLISGYIFAKFSHFFHEVPDKRSSSVFACLLVILHATQASAEIGTAWCATTGVIEIRTNLGLDLAQASSAIFSIILVQIHYGTIILLIIAKSGFNPASAIKSKNPGIRIFALVSIISSLGGNVVFDATICFMISFNLIRSGCLNLGTRMRTVVWNLLLLTLRTFLLTTVLMAGLVVVTLSAILPRNPNAQLAKGVPLMWMYLTSFLSRVYILSFFSSFVGKSNQNVKNAPSPQFLNSFKIKTLQSTESSGATTTDHDPQGSRISHLPCSQ